MTKQTKKYAEYPISTLRESLRLQAEALAEKLRRSVARLTSCDLLPCTEYGEEVAYEHDLAERLFYLQSCRNALEQCISTGATRQRYRWRDGRVTVTRFRRVSTGRVRVSGEQPLTRQ